MKDNKPDKIEEIPAEFLKFVMLNLDPSLREEREEVIQELSSNVTVTTVDNGNGIFTHTFSFQRKI